MSQLKRGKPSQTEEKNISATKFVCGAFPVFEKLGDIAKTAEKHSSVVVSP